MKKTLLFISLLLGFAGVAIAQSPSPCKATLTKSGIGLTRTYSVSSIATGAVNYHVENSSTSSNTNTSSLPVNYTIPGYYYIYASATTANCTDTAYMIDTVYGAIVCPTNFSISTYSFGTNPQFFFSAINEPVVPPGYSRTVLLDYGDGTTGTSPGHNYMLPQNNAKVKMTITYTHPTYNTCILKDSTYINISTCAGNSNQVIHSDNGYNHQFTNLKTSPAGSGYISTTTWYRSSNPVTNYQYIGTGNTFNYVFPANGQYVVSATTYWYNPNIADSLCITTDTVHVDVTNRLVLGLIINSAYGVLNYTPQVKTWLIKHDSAAGTLNAIDSTVTVTYSSGTGLYSSPAYFKNFPYGNYFTKSHVINQPTGANNGFLPTYSSNSAYWYGADTLVFTGNNRINKSTTLLSGTPTSGPGFIGGLISAGANKGTAEGDPVAGIDVLLRDISGKLISVATTGADGRYTFQNIGAGVYTVYPEELNFRTTPSDSIVISATTAGITPRYNFKRNDADKEYVPSISLGVSTITNLKATIIPNPATDKLQINLGTSAGKVTATLSNAAGQVVMQEVITGSNATLSVSQLPAGLYLLQLQNGKQVITEKVQIRH